MTSEPNRPATRLRLPFEAASASVARRLLGNVLSERGGVSRTAMADAALVLYELVMNGVNHGRPHPDGTLSVCWEIQDGVLCVLVQDHGTSGVVAARSPSADQDGGRGLAIVAAVSERWSVVRDDDTEVSAWLRLAI